MEKKELVRRKVQKPKAKKISYQYFIEPRDQHSMNWIPRNLEIAPGETSVRNVYFGNRQTEAIIYEITLREIGTYLTSHFCFYIYKKGGKDGGLFEKIYMIKRRNINKENKREEDDLKKIVVPAGGSAEIVQS